MSDTDEKIKPTEDLRRSKRKKFHLDVVAVLSRRSPDFRRKDPDKIRVKRPYKNSVEVPVLEPIFPILGDDKNLLKVSTPENDDKSNKRHSDLEQNGLIPAKRQKEGTENVLIDQIKVESKPLTKSIVCYKCLMTFKSNAGLGKHVKTCKKDSTRLSLPTRLPSDLLLNDKLLQSSIKNSLIKTEKKESDSESLDDSNEIDDAMPILTPECSLNSQKSTSVQITKASVGKLLQGKRKQRRIIANNSLQAPFDIKKALTLKLEIPPVPRIVVESPIDKYANHIYCSKCPYKCNDKNLLGLHEIMHNKIERSYQCKFCSYSAFSPDALHYHLNLHAPALSPNTAVTLRKQINANKRNGVMHNDMFTPTTSNVVQRMEQVQTQQQRLVSIIKRSTGDEHNTHGRTKTKLPLPSTKFYSCKKCSFRSERKENLIFHEELHGSRFLYACEHCDYASDAMTVRDFHQRNHHFEFSLTTHAKNLAVNILKKKAAELTRRCSSLPMDAGFEEANVIQEEAESTLSSENTLDSVSYPQVVANDAQQSESIHTEVS